MVSHMLFVLYGLQRILRNGRTDKKTKKCCENRIEKSRLVVLTKRSSGGFNPKYHISLKIFWLISPPRNITRWEGTIQKAESIKEKGQ